MSEDEGGGVLAQMEGSAEEKAFWQLNQENIIYFMQKAGLWELNDSLAEIVMLMEMENIEVEW